MKALGFGFVVFIIPPAKMPAEIHFWECPNACKELEVGMFRDFRALRVQVDGLSGLGTEGSCGLSSCFTKLFPGP